MLLPVIALFRLSALYGYTSPYSNMALLRLMHASQSATSTCKIFPDNLVSSPCVRCTCKDFVRTIGVCIRSLDREPVPVKACSIHLRLSRPQPARTSLSPDVYGLIRYVQHSRAYPVVTSIGSVYVDMNGSAAPR